MPLLMSCTRGVQPLVGLGLGGAEARLKRGPLMTSSYSANRDMHALLIKPKIRPPKDTFLRLWND